MSAPAWFKKVAVNEIPNFTGVIAKPFFKIGLCLLNSAISLRRVIVTAALAVRLSQVKSCLQRFGSSGSRYGLLRRSSLPLRTKGSFFR